MAAQACSGRGGGSGGRYGDEWRRARLRCRADALACYGNPVTKTPNLDLLAWQGTIFRNCHVQNPVCAQSRCSMLTGWPTSVRGHRSLYYLLRKTEPNMFRYLKNAGYDVFFFGKNDALTPDSVADSVTEWEDSATVRHEFVSVWGAQDSKAPFAGDVNAFSGATLTNAIRRRPTRW